MSSVGDTLERQSEMESLADDNACLWQKMGLKIESGEKNLLFNFIIVVMIYSVHTSTNMRYVCFFPL